MISKCWNNIAVSRRVKLFAVYSLVFVCMVVLVHQMDLIPFTSNRVNTMTKPLALNVKFESTELLYVQPTDNEENEETTALPNEETTALPTEASEELTTFENIQEKTTQTTTLETTTQGDPPMILLWNNQPHPPYPIPEIPMCGGGCHLTTSRITVTLSDAVVFGMKPIKADDLPKKESRRHDQVYVYWTEESAWTSTHFYGKDFNTLEHNYFNWTMTYKRDSDVNAMMIPYNARDYVINTVRTYEKLHDLPSRFARVDQEEPVPPKPKTEWEKVKLRGEATKLIRKKKKMAAWVASNCGYTAGAAIRKKIVDELKAIGVQVDIFGNCGNKTVPYKLKPFIEMMSEYHFYLAFENSRHCRGYITEKFWYNGLYAGVVPIVWGPMKADIEAVAPPNSYIFFEDFKDTKALSRYMLRLTKHEDEYMKYFEWWWKTPGYYPIAGITETETNTAERNEMLDFEMNALCHLCSMLRRGVHKKTKKTIYSLNDLWYRDENELCLSKTEVTKTDTPERKQGGSYPSSLD